MTPTTKIVCPSCDKALLFRGPAPEGKAVKCPGCATVFRVPASRQPAEDEDDEAPRPSQRAVRATPPPKSAPARRPQDEDEDLSEERERSRRPKRKKSGSMLVWGLLGGGLLVLVLCGGCAGVVGYLIWGPVSWKEFSPPEGRFTATFPGTPKKQTQQAAGQPIQMYIVELSLGRFAYSVAYNELGANVEGMGAKAALDGAARGLGGKIVSQKDIKLQGHPGKEVTLELQEQGVTMVLTNRMYVVKSRMYQVVVAGVKGQEPPASYSRFLDSFKLLD